LVGLLAMNVNAIVLYNTTSPDRDRRSSQFQARSQLLSVSGARAKRVKQAGSSNNTPVGWRSRLKLALTAIAMPARGIASL
jgi:hypothetical protein